MNRRTSMASEKRSESLRNRVPTPARIWNTVRMGKTARVDSWARMRGRARIGGWARLWIPARIGAREERVWLLVLPLIVLVITALLAPSYGTTYATADDLARAVVNLRFSKVAAALYGVLPAGANTVQLAVWELGALTCLILGIVVVLRTVQRSRASEDAGRSEMLRAIGVGPASEVAATAVVMSVECLLLGLAGGVGLLALNGARVIDVAIYGAAIAGLCLLMSAGALVLAQLTGDAVHARAAGVGAMIALYAGHGAWAAWGWAWAGAWSPFALRAAMDPGGRNEWQPLVCVAVALAVLLLAATIAARRRDIEAGVIRARRRRPRPVRAAGPVSFALRLCRGQLLTWAVLISVLAAIFTSMGKNMVDLARAGATSGGALGSQLGTADPGTDFLRYIGVLVGAVTAVQAIGLAGRFASDERAGLVEGMRGTGNGPARLLLAWCFVACLGAAVTLALATATAAFVGSTVLDTSAAQALRVIGGQWPACAACAGITAVLSGWWPRLNWIAWVVMLVGLGIAQLGPSIGMPEGVIDAGLFAQAGDPWSGGLVALAVVGSALGALGVRRRDLQAMMGRGPLRRRRAFTMWGAGGGSGGGRMC